VLKKLFRTFYNRVLVTDFCGAYNSAISLTKQKSAAPAVESVQDLSCSAS